MHSKTQGPYSHLGNPSRWLASAINSAFRELDRGRFVNSAFGRSYLQRDQGDEF